MILTELLNRSAVVEIHIRSVLFNHFGMLSVFALLHERLGK